MSNNNSHDPRFNQNQNWPFQQNEPFRGHAVPGKPTPFEAPSMSSSNTSPHGQDTMPPLRFPGGQPPQFQFQDFNKSPHGQDTMPPLRFPDGQPPQFQFQDFNKSPHGQDTMPPLRFPGERPPQFQSHDFNTLPMPGAPPRLPQPHQFQNMQKQQQHNVYPIHTAVGMNTSSDCTSPATTAPLLSPTMLPPNRKLPPIPGQGDATNTRPDNTSGMIEEGTKIDQPPRSGFQEVQQTVDKLNDNNKETSIYQKSFKKGMDVVIAASSAAETSVTLVDKGVAVTTKLMESNVVKELVSNVGKNPAVNQLIQLADKLVDIGKAVPFIAPAFIILKIIIDIEQKARDADAKCEDLLERINFMVSNIMVLEKVKVIDPLKVVIEKMNDTLKMAASLIRTYRKQGAIARRLNMSNSQNFVHMADKIMGCSQDLMLSLQIQQTGDLSVLSRAIPVDDQDEEARTFVSTHGGQSVINSSPELVEEFAKKMQLTMNDQVMGQMQSSMEDILGENQSRIETLLNENSTTIVADTIKALAAEVREQEAERKLTCLQCDKEYRQTANGAEACSFHKGLDVDGTFTCCGKKSPCAFSNHRSVHHCEYPYTNFFEYAYGITSRTSTVKEWAVAYESHVLTYEFDFQRAQVGRLIRWRPGQEEITTPMMVIIVGCITFDTPYYFQVFDAESLSSADASVRQTGNTLIFRTAKDDNEYSMAEWTLDDVGSINGVRLSAKVATSDAATVKAVPIDIKMVSLSGEVQMLSDGKFRIYKPAEPYTFPETRYVGHVARTTPLREQREFKARTKLPLIVIPQSKMQANLGDVRGLRTDADKFQGELRIFNKATPSSQNFVTLVSCKAQYRLVGDKDYKNVEFLGLGNTKFPVSVAPTQFLDIPFEVIIRRNAAQAALEEDCREWAMIALHHPVRIRLTFKDIEDEECIFVQEYVHEPWGRIETKESNDISFLHIDNALNACRSVARVKAGESDTFVNVAGTRLSVKDLNRIVYKAEQSGVTEVDLGHGDDVGHFKLNTWALVDLSCRRVYGFKVLLEEGSSRPKKTTAALGYAPCPIYGEGELEVRPIRYAEEKVVFPQLEVEDISNVVVDDEVDDDKAAITVQAVEPVIAIATAASSSITAVISEVSKATNSLDAVMFSSSMATLEKRLESLDNNVVIMSTNVARMATALERLADILSN
ncbi:hypothetical protein BGZ83_011821 [Gryganskiella cystojenkinii]|nr:hypothetical protein BGZ83_011821 [Gryganskiella cystojenkinii]